jgi:uncharacterized protein YjdB
MARPKRSVIVTTCISSVFCLLLVACGASPDNISVTPAEGSMSKIGATLQLEAEARDRRGAKVSGVIISYKSRDPSVASVNSSGLVTAVNHGTTIIDVTIDGTDAMEFVRVTNRIPEKIDVRPSTGSVNIGGIQKLTAKVLDRDGKSFGNIRFEWSSSDESKASVDAGSVTGLDESEVVITASALGLKGTSKLRVVWAPGQKALIEAEKRFKARTNRARGRRSQGGGGSSTGSDPRLGMFQ